MESKREKETVLIHLSKNESIVFLAWLYRINKLENSSLYEDQAEQRILWDLEASLETISELPFDTNYNSVLEKAREEIRDKE